MRTLAAKQNLAQYEEWRAEYAADAEKAHEAGKWIEAAIYEAQMRTLDRVIADVRYAFEDVEEELAA